MPRYLIWEVTENIHIAALLIVTTNNSELLDSVTRIVLYSLPDGDQMAVLLDKSRAPSFNLHSHRVTHQTLNINIKLCWEISFVQSKCSSLFSTTTTLVVTTEAVADGKILDTFWMPTICTQHTAATRKRERERDCFHWQKWWVAVYNEDRMKEHDYRRKIIQFLLLSCHFQHWTELQIILQSIDTTSQLKLALSSETSEERNLPLVN